MKERRTIPGKLPARQVPGWCLFIWVPTSDASCCEPGRNPTTHRRIPSTLLLISLLCLLLPLASTGRRCGEGRTGSRKEWGERAVEPTHLPTHKGRRRGADATLSSETGPWKTCYFVQSLSCVRLFVTSWTVAHQAPLSMGFPSNNNGVGCHFLFQGNFRIQGSNLPLLHQRVDSLLLDHQGSPISEYSTPICEYTSNLQAKRRLGKVVQGTGCGNSPSLLKSQLWPHAVCCLNPGNICASAYSSVKWGQWMVNFHLP